MRHRSRTGWQKLSFAGFLTTLACSARPGPETELGWDDEPGTVSGELAIRIADFADGTRETIYVLRGGPDKERRLVFQNHPDLDPGAKLKVWGAAGPDGIVVDRYESAPDLTGPLGSQSSALINPTPQAPRIFCPVVVTINNGNVPANMGVAQTEAQFHSGPKSVNAYFIENSYGRNSISGKTYGPFNHNMSGCDYSGVADAIKPMIADKCDQYGFLMVPNVSACNWAGLGDVGTATKPASDTWYNADLSCGATVQEPGHNFGMNHSSSITCPGGAFADDLAACKHNEYGDLWDTMGDGCRHMNVWQKQYQGWFGGCNAVKVTSSGTFNLVPLEAACDGIQSLQIPFPNGKTRPFPQGRTDNTDTTMTTYYFEYRISLGVDQGMVPQVLVHAAPNPMTGGSKAAPHTWVLFASGNTKNPGLTAGKSFSDPAGGLTVTVTALDPEKATIQVDYPAGAGASPTCLDGTTLTPPGPVTCTGAVTPDGGVVLPPDGGFAGAGGGGRDAGRDTGVGTGGASGGFSDGGNSVGSGGLAGASSSGGAAGGSLSGSGGSGVGGATGSGGSPPGAGGVAAGGSGVGGSRPRASAPENLDGGCSCRIANESRPSGNALATLATGLFLSLARRRRGGRRGIETGKKDQNDAPRLR